MKKKNRTQVPAINKLKPQLDLNYKEAKVRQPAPIKDYSKLKADTRKRSIHVLVYDETHVELKIACTRKHMSMQDFLEVCINRFIDGDIIFEKLTDEFVRLKNDKTIKRVSITDEDAVYRAINEE